MEKMTKTKAARHVVAGVFGSVEPGPNISDHEEGARAFLARTGARFVARYLGDFEKCREWGEDDAGRAGRIDGRATVCRCSPCGSLPRPGRCRSGSVAPSMTGGTASSASGCMMFSLA